MPVLRMAVASSFISDEEPGEYFAGDVIAGKYWLERPLGQGGQGYVWQARNEVLDARVAIKVVHSETADETQKRRLLQEARSAAQLGHPAIVRVFDFGQTDRGDPYLVMELLEGMSLGDRITQSRRLFDVDTARLLLPIADALVHAHAFGLVHRDLKPDNVFLVMNGESVQPKLLDFGVVKMQPLADRAGHLTQTGAVVGSPAYLSPEQARGLDDIDQRADVWSFSAMLYECVTGELPFKGANYNALMRSIVEDAPTSLVELGVSDEAFWKIVERGLAKSREDRWPSMLALGRALAGWLLERGAPDDVCGVSLEFKWLRSQSTPRALTSSLPVLEPPNTPLLPVERSRFSPTLLSLMLGAGALLALLTTLLILFARSRPEPPSPPEPAAAPAVEAKAPIATSLPSLRAPVMASASERVSPATPSASVQVVPSVRAPRERPTDTRPSTKPAVSAPSAPPREPALDLLNPY